MMLNENGQLRKTAGATFQPENMRDMDRGEASSSEPEVEEEAEGLISLECSDLMLNENGQLRKTAGATLQPENMRDMDRGEASSSEPEVEEKAEGLISLECSDLMLNENGQLRKTVGATLQPENMRDMDRGEASSSEPEVEEKAEGLISLECSDLMLNENGQLRKTAGATLQPENMRDMDRGEASSSEPEVEEKAEGLIRGSDSEVGRHRVRPGIRGELVNVLLLLFLYVLQGIPLGLAASIPLILQSKNVSYKDQAIFSFVFWPFCLKLLWAPLVDALYFSRFGRRKSWLVPTQYLLGICMLCLSATVNSLLQSERPDVVTLTAVFFMLTFLAATQDIVVDGWALTMLSRENVGYASTCNSVGQAAGYFLGNVLFLALESADFCNKYLRVEPKDTGIVTLPNFLLFWGVVFMVSTTLVAILKRENEHGKGKQQVHEETHGVMETYKLLFSIIRMPTVFTYCALLLTAKMGFSAADAVTGLKLVQGGLPKEQLALLAVPLVPLQILLPMIISKCTAGPKPLNVFYIVFPFRLFIGLGYALLVWWTPSVKQEGGFPVYYYAIVVLSQALYEVPMYSMSVACMAFHAKVSDPLIGATYMTLLNTISNLAKHWPETLALALVDPLTSKECQGAVGQSCGSPAKAGLCTKEGGVCVTTLDGYYVESGVCVVIGLVWWVWLGRKMRRLQDQSPAAWRCKPNE